MPRRVCSLVMVAFVAFACFVRAQDAEIAHPKTESDPNKIHNHDRAGDLPSGKPASANRSLATPYTYPKPDHSAANMGKTTPALKSKDHHAYEDLVKAESGEASKETEPEAHDHDPCNDAKESLSDKHQMNCFGRTKASNQNKVSAAPPNR